METTQATLTADQRLLLKGLESHPKLMDRFLSILSLAEEPDSDGTIRSADEVEALLIEEVRKLGKQGMESWAGKVNSLVGEQSKKRRPQCTITRKKTLRWWSTFGLIEVSESLWRSSAKSYLRVLPEALKVRSRSCSLRLQRVLCDFGMEDSFAQSVQRLSEHYGFEVSPGAVAKITLKHAAKMGSQSEKKPHCLPAKGKEQIVAEADGSFLRIVRFDGKDKSDKRKGRKVDYREVRLCAASAHESNEVRYAATFEDVDQVSHLWAHCGKTAGMGLNSRVHVVCDGAAWIRTQSENAFGDQATVLIDFYHVCDYLSQVNQSVESLPRRWFQTQKKRLRQGRVSALLKDLEGRLEATGVSDENAPVRRAHRYLKNRLDALDYKQALEDELPIGSGLIESAHKHVLQSRMKIPGASWRIEHAEIMVQARAFRANKQWNQYWKKAA